MNNIKTIVFDLYNTLIEIKESNHFFLKLFKLSYNGFNMSLPVYLNLVMTKDFKDLINILPSEFEELFDKNRIILETELNSIVVYKETYNTLESLKKDFRLFLISNLASPYKSPVFEKNLEQYFEGIIFSCDYGFLKPNQEIFREVERLTKNEASEILMVGDSFKSDIRGAQNMAWNYLKINRNGRLSKDYEIKDLNEIKKHITMYKRH